MSNLSKEDFSNILNSSKLLNFDLLILLSLNHLKLLMRSKVNLPAPNFIPLKLCLLSKCPWWSCHQANGSPEGHCALFDPSAAFNTIYIYHSLPAVGYNFIILLPGLALLYLLDLSWVKSYLVPRSSNKAVYSLTLTNTLSSLFSILSGVPHVMRPLIFILYSTPLSSLISNSPINHHL